MTAAKRPWATPLKKGKTASRERRDRQDWFIQVLECWPHFPGSYRVVAAPYQDRMAEIGALPVRLATDWRDREGWLQTCHARSLFDLEALFGASLP